MNRMTRPSLSLISLRTALSRSSNSPRNLAPGDERAQVQRDDALVLERLGHVAADDPLGQALDDGRLADARLADEDRVVLGPAAQDLDDAADLVVAADDRVELAGARLDGQVAAVLLQGGVRALGVLRGDALAAADALEGLEDRLLAGRVALQQGLRLAAGLGDAEEQVLGRDVVVAEAARLGLGMLDDAPWPAGPAPASHPGSGRAGPGCAATSPRNPGRSTPSRRRVSAGMPSSGSTRALSRCSASSTGLCSRWAVAWAARTASWAFWVKRSSCMSGLSRAGVGLADEVEESRGAASRASSVEVGRQDDPDPDEQVAVAGRP